MAPPIDLIAYENAGFPVELADERDWRREIRRNRLRRTSEVTVYRAGSPPRRQLAETVAELEALFDELDPKAAAAPPPGAFRSPATDDRPALQSWDAGAGERDQEQAVEAREFLGESDDHFYEPPDERPPPGHQAGTMLLLILIPLLLFAAIAVLVRGGSGRPDAPDAAAVAWSVSERANVRDAPGVQGSRVVATLRPGETVEGTIVADGPGEDWVRISAGRHEGRYVWTGNLRIVSDAGVFNTL